MVSVFGFQIVRLRTMPLTHSRGENTGHHLKAKHGSANLPVTSCNLLVLNAQMRHKFLFVSAHPEPR